MPRALGYLPDPPKAPGEKPDFDSRLLLRAAPVPRVSRNRDLIVEILNQGRFGSCTANAIMQAVRASHVEQWRHAGIGGVPPLGSRLWTYYFARALSGDTDRDVGSYLRLAFQALNQHGFCPESAWPYVEAGDVWRTMPSKSAIRAAFDQRSAGSTGFPYYRIFEEGDERIAMVKRALGARQLVVFGTDVSDEFVNGDFGTQPVDPSIGHRAGGHAMVAVEHEDGIVSANDVVLCASSWGEEWGERGYYKATPDSISKWRDIWIVRVAPRYSGEGATP